MTRVFPSGLVVHGPMTMVDRVENYRRTIGKKWPGSIPTLVTHEDGTQTIQGVWVIGNDYSGAKICRCEDRNTKAGLLQVSGMREAESASALALQPGEESDLFSEVRAPKESARSVCRTCKLPLTSFYGAYPRSYLDRVLALFPDVARRYDVLHVFSGSLPESDRYVRCDLVQPAEYRCSVYDLPAVCADAGVSFRLVLADPPYSSADAVNYGTPMVDRRRATAALAEVTAVGGHLVWLDTVWPMHRKDAWKTVGRIMLQRSTNHRVRAVSIFERVA